MQQATEQPMLYLFTRILFIAPRIEIPYFLVAYRVSVPIE